MSAVIRTADFGAPQAQIQKLPGVLRQQAAGVLGSPTASTVSLSPSQASVSASSLTGYASVSFGSPTNGVTRSPSQVRSPSNTHEQLMQSQQPVLRKSIGKCQGNASPPIPVRQVSGDVNGYRDSSWSIPAVNGHRDSMGNASPPLPLRNGHRDSMGYASPPFPVRQFSGDLTYDGLPWEKMIERLFYESDQTRDNKLSWNEGEIMSFIKTLFKRCGWPDPNWQQTEYYKIYKKYDVDNDYSLELKECILMASEIRGIYEPAPPPPPKKDMEPELRREIALLRGKLSKYEKDVVPLLQLKMLRQMKIGSKMFQRIFETQTQTLVKHFFNSWRMNARHLSDVSKMFLDKVQYKVRCRESITGAMARTFKTFENFTKSAAMELWQEVHVRCKLDKTREQLVRKSEALLRSVAAAQGLPIAECFCLWQKVVVELRGEEKAERLRKEKGRLQMQLDELADAYYQLQDRLEQMSGYQREAALKAMRALIGGQADALRSESFSLWHKIVRESISKRRFEKIQVEYMKLKMKCSKDAMMAVTKLLGSHATLLQQHVMRQWLETVEEIKRERREERQRQAFLEQQMEKEKAAKKAMAALIGGHAKSTMQMVLAAWIKLQTVLKHEMELDRLRDEIMSLKAKASESAVRAIATLMSGSDKQLLERGFFAWQADMDQMKHENELTRLREDILRLQMKNSENVMRALGAMMGNQPLQIMEKAFFSWVSAMDELRHSHETERLRDEIIMLKVKNSEGLVRAVSSMMGTQPRALMERGIQAWTAMMVELKHEKELDRLREEILDLKAKQSEGAYKAIAALMGHSEKQLKERAIKAWCAEMEELRHENELDRLREQLLRYQASSQEANYRAISALMGSRDKQLKERGLRGWMAVMEDANRNAEARELRRKLLVKEVQQASACFASALFDVLVLWGHETRLLLVRYMAAWQIFAKEFRGSWRYYKLERRLKRAQSSIQRAVQMYLSTDVAMERQEMFKAWKQHVFMAPKFTHTSGWCEPNRPVTIEGNGFLADVLGLNFSAESPRTPRNTLTPRVKTHSRRLQYDDT